MTDGLAFYLRLSMADGDLGKDNKDESNSIENQRLLLQSYVEASDEFEGEAIEYIDDGYTGTNFRRPSFQRMIEDAKKGKIHRYFDNTILYYRYAPVSRLIMGGWVIVFFAFIAHLKPVALSKIAATKLVTILDNYSYYVYLVHGVLCMGAFNVYEHLSWQPATITFFMGTAVLACGLKHLSDCITKVLEK